YHAGENIGRAQAVFGPVHNAIVYLFTGSKDQAEYYDALLDRIAASTRFTTMDPAGLVKQWEDLLAGMALTYVEHDSSGDAGGDNRSTVWNLCRDGRFTYSHSSHAAVQVPGADVPDTSEDHRRGTWRVEAADGNALLILTEEQGAVASHTVAYDGDKMYVDEQRVVRAKSEDCP
ncbi:MAG: hypothetical protein ACREJU_13555, partial [Nitrospiraceae bacterium]